MPPTTITLVCAADARYVMPLAVMLGSVVEHLRAGVGLTTYVLDGGLLAADRERLEAVVGTRDVALRWIDADPRQVADLPTWGRMPSTTYQRLSIGGALPAEEPKAIWLDCDVVVTTDLTRLWETDLGGSPVLAAQDQLVPFVSSRDGIRRWRELGLPAGAKYFNAGVMVIDLDRWRDEDLGSQAGSYLRRYRDDVMFWDQEGLNAVLCGRWSELDPRWNHNASVAGRPFFKARHLAPVASRALADDPWIVHFSGTVKPWVAANVADWPRTLYFRHLDRTPWAGWRPRRTPARALVGWYESSRLRHLLYPAEAWAMRLLRAGTQGRGRP